MASAKVAKAKKLGSGKKVVEVDEEMRNLENYDILSTIGTGTFGRVVLVRHKESKNYFALKVMAITEVIRLKQIEHVKNEKEILASISHPFIVNMLWANHDQTFLYMMMEYVPGGEIFSYLRNYGRFNNSTGTFYACEIVSALDYLHARSIVYRDLKPENLLLDREGHLKITDFGFAKKLLDRTWTLCGTPEYLAPEIIQSKGYNKAVDWWSLGILIYEMLVGYPPFFDEQPFAIYEKILAGRIEWPKHLDPVAKDIIKKLLVQDRTKRLGNMKNGADDVKRHKWFKNVDWDEVAARKLIPPITPEVLHAGDTSNYHNRPPPIVPKVSHAGDTKNFDEYAEDDWIKARPAEEKDVTHFQDF